MRFDIINRMISNMQEGHSVQKLKTRRLEVPKKITIAH